MTHTPNIARHAHRRAAALLLAAVAIPATAWAQDTVTPPTVLVPSQPAPAPAPVAPPVATTQSQPGQSRTTIAPGVIEQAQQEARERAAARRAERAEPRPQQRAARSAPVAERAAAPTAVPAPTAAPEAAAPVAVEPLTTAPAEPVDATPPPVESAAPVTAAEADVAQQPDAGRSSIWLILAGLGLAAAAIAAFLLLRRRRDDDVVHENYEAQVYEPVAEPVAVAPVYEERVVQEPVTAAPRVADPVAAAPLFTPRPTIAETHGDDADVEKIAEPQPALENAEMVTADAADIEAVLGGAKPQGSRPQLELAVRPTRAGMSRRGAMVEFELTVANSGGAPAEDVRIGAFMLGGNPAQDAEIERLLIDPPADSVMPSDRIEPGDGRRLDASVTLPRDHVDAATDEGGDGFTPILVADARYRMPDGSEGRTAAAFTIGRVNGGEHLVPIALQDDPAMYADIEARLHSVPAKV